MWRTCGTCILLLLGSASLAAGVYKWVDEQGKVHFTDTPPAGQNVEQVEIREVNSFTSTSEVLEVSASFAQGAPQQVVMYSASWCHVCKRAAEYFRVNDIDYREYDVENDRKGRRDYKRLQGDGVPIILVGKRRMNGFSPSGFEALRRAAADDS